MTSHVAPPAELKLTVGDYHLDLNEKKPIPVTLPGTFKIKILTLGNSGVTINSGGVTVEAKSSGGLTIEGDNSADVHKIAVTVNGVPDPEGDGIYDFWIHVEGVGTLDPKVRVVGDETMSSLQADAVYDLLDTLNISLEDANKLRPPP